MKTKLKRFFDQFNIKKEAEDLGVSFWQSPSFLFILMGFIIIVVMTSVYYISKNYDSPELLIVVESLVVIVLFTIGNFIIKSVEEVAQANKMKTEFVSIASHQLKTPLSEINWEVELIMSKFQKGLNEKQKTIISEIGKSNKKMVRLVNDLLDVARIDQGRLALNSEPIDIMMLIQDVLKNNKIFADANHVNLKLKAAKNIPEIIGDKRRIWVVLDNLISNGIKYIEKKGKVEIAVSTKGSFVKVVVSDNGVGIAKNQQDKIFQKFFRVDNITKSQTEGTGLGLYIAKNIVEQSGGSIEFESRENEGTTFSFWLPVKAV